MSKPQPPTFGPLISLISFTLAFWLGYYLKSTNQYPEWLTVQVSQGYLLVGAIIGTVLTLILIILMLYIKYYE